MVFRLFMSVLTLALCARLSWLQVSFQVHIKIIIARPPPPHHHHETPSPESGVEFMAPISGAVF